ncbi:beta-lactamase regulating signal transducer with metallopeptidase domain [Flavobacterium arsenatis]|uniref:Beta-lactamase regulating signal transducer with metallopeptidase domain n=1 Tax=Flavobacterium arsenatis TaxID=1484332 RepID=A0ABU1TTM0_9FLAO|nr:M56 family metallopeptidase [Flavobacterium arsenatis]MDR6969229.1 beta-lactamase regulating signal transducer with metallopeptidase domain [Flavobacterium arsenatis]
MTDFLLKSTLCLGLLFAVYFFLLEKEKMHHFNRFFLLFSLAFSLVIPFISFEIYVETIQAFQQNTIQMMPISSEMIEEKTDYLPIILWSVYGLITTILMFRFVVNLIKIKEKIDSNPQEKIQNATLVLLEEKVLPHTFLNYIFINKDDYENRKIEDELYTHELTHVRQKHTLDILFIEILKTIFWFNPILIFYKKAIQLNHEFLADEKVVKSYNNVPFYQNLLLEKATWNNTFYLASNLNFLVTKKRLIMMTKTTSKSRALLKKIALVPVLAVLIFISCSENKEATTEIETTNEEMEVQALQPDEVPSQPEFPGGMEAFYEFFGKEYKIPEDFSEEGKLIIAFVVETDGSLSNLKIKKDEGFGTGEEAIRVLKKSPKWQPGLVKGKAVRVQYHLPISIKR